MSTSGMTYDEISESVTGFDELATEKHFGIDLYTDGEAKPVKLLRALVFVHMRHQGTSDETAKQQVMGMPLGEVNAYFDSPPADADDDDEPDPETDSGKGESLLGDVPSD